MKYIWIHMVSWVLFPTCKNINIPLGILMVLQFGKRVPKTLVFHCSNHSFFMIPTEMHYFFIGNDKDFWTRFANRKNTNNPIGLLMILHVGKRNPKTLVFHCSNQHFSMTFAENSFKFIGNTCCFRMPFPNCENSNIPNGLLMVLQAGKRMPKTLVFIAQINTFPWLSQKTASNSLEIHAAFECLFRTAKTAINLMDYWWFCKPGNACQKHWFSLLKSTLFHDFDCKLLHLEWEFVMFSNAFSGLRKQL